MAEALALLRHRGPDGQGIWASRRPSPPFVALGHRRLAIIDLSDAGAQPMPSEDGALWLTYNGEIYNYLELMAELQAKGHRFRSGSDTEVILKAYEEWGERCLERFNGMFAFAIWDERRQELFAARDRFGEKPFHYAWDEKRGFFAFASEMKSLVALPEVDTSLDERALYRYIAFHELAGAEQTLSRGIRRLPHAHWLRLSWRGRFELKLQRYWDIDLEQESLLTFKDAAGRFAELFADSIRLRLRSDVPVGSSLSGGLDSSIVVCQIHALGAAGGQQTFSARMEDPLLDEGRHIATVLAKTGIQGREVWPRAAEFQSSFEKLCYHLEEPFLSTSQFAQHLVMRLASEHGVTVLLDGQGADELLAGYDPYFLAHYYELVDKRRWLTLWREWRGFRSRHPRPFPLTARSIAARLYPATLERSKKSPGDASGQSEPSLTSMIGWCEKEWLDEFRHEEPPSLPASSRDRLTRKLYADAMQGELQELLRYGDRNSMAWSREVRQPFLDHRLAELLFALPPQYKMAGGQTKVILREAMGGLVPESIVRRQDKLGYQAPLPAWLKNSLSSWAEDRLSQMSADFAGRLVSDAGEKFRKVAGAINEASARAVFSLLTLAETSNQLAEVARAPAAAL